MSHYVMHKRTIQYKQAITFDKQYLSHSNNNFTLFQWKVIDKKVDAIALLSSEGSLLLNLTAK